MEFDENPLRQRRISLFQGVHNIKWMMCFEGRRFCQSIQTHFPHATSSVCWEFQINDRWFDASHNGKRPQCAINSNSAHTDSGMSMYGKQNSNANHVT